MRNDSVLITIIQFSYVIKEMCNNAMTQLI